MHQQHGRATSSAQPLKSKPDPPSVAVANSVFIWRQLRKGHPISQTCCYDACMKNWLFLAAVNGALAVMAGAFAAHGLKAWLDADKLAVFETGARYQMYHALAMGLAALAGGKDSGPRAAPYATAAAALFLAGIVLFCGSLYLLALTAAPALVLVTPLGGLAFLAGWAALAVAALKRDGS
jgi:uncharacterized membrane protein YgdD (TMEM256/DUF423 family)